MPWPIRTDIKAAQERGMSVADAEGFQAFPGGGVAATVAGHPASIVR